jgi:hypothetical protein
MTSHPGWVGFLNPKFAVARAPGRRLLLLKAGWRGDWDTIYVATSLADLEFHLARENTAPNHEGRRTLARLLAEEDAPADD